MLLVTFVENCFKYGISPVEKSSIIIGLTEKSGSLEFSTHNHVFPVKREGDHLGIENCRKRLELLYPGKFVMDIVNDSGSYDVKLCIDLTR